MYHPIDHQAVEEDDVQNLPRMSNMIAEQSAEDHTQSGMEPSLGQVPASNPRSPDQPMNSVMSAKEEAA